jgi:hypothetical protein
MLQRRLSISVHGHTIHTPLHATKLPLSVWMKGVWFVLQSDKGVFFRAWPKPWASASRQLGVWATPCDFS